MRELTGFEESRPTDSSQINSDLAVIKELVMLPQAAGENVYKIMADFEAWELGTRGAQKSVGSANVL
jgi:hypothetical protein